MLATRAWRVLPSALLRPLSTLPVTTASLEEARGVLRLAGAGVLQFLQGLVTNDVLALEPPGAPPVYACLLNAQGRSLHDMLFFRTADAEPTLLVDTDAQGKEDLLRLLKRYRLRQKIAIDDVSDDVAVWVQFGGPVPQPSGPWQTDPRLAQLGLRGVLPKGEGPSAAAAAGGDGGLAGWREYRRWRILQGVAEGDSEIPSGEVIPLEFNIDGLQGISFTKGCYVGQELMARTHFKGVVRKRAMPFRLEQPAPGLQPGSEVFERDAASGRFKAVGKVRVVEDDVGLAVLRLGRVMQALDAGRPLYVAAGGEFGEGHVEATVWRPDWWPAAWGREEQQGAGGGDE